MTGKYEIEIYNNKAHYFLTIQRNLTILQGFSATGKTELVRLIDQCDNFGASSGITIKSAVPCHVIQNGNWEMMIRAYSGCILFIDENVNFTKSKRFAELVKESDNYFVIITRDDLYELPYSVDEIYGLRNVSDTQKYKTFHKVYNEMYKLYHFDLRRGEFEAVITEDSNSGYEFYRHLFGDRCLAAAGKSKVYECVLKEERSVLAVVDGAAFGPEIGKLMRYIESNHKNCVLYAPESFEYLILCAGIMDIDRNMIDATYDYADSTKYMSWERFYTEYLAAQSKGTVFQYQKRRLNKAYLTEGTLKKIVLQLPDLIQRNALDR